ncbi:MAG: hypothetical protein ACOC8C_02505, partial [Chloroflexota bacterium]
MAILVYLALQGARQPAAETPTPTEGVEATPSEPASAAPAPSCRTILTSGDVEISMALPVSVTVGRVDHRVEPFVPQEQAWTYPVG